MRIIFFGKQNDEHTDRALEYCKKHFSNVMYFLGQWGDPFPEAAKGWQGDYILSYLSRWLFSGSFLKNAERAAINFHPASPEYPGIGCINFAMYEGASSFGTTCHHMREKVDSGPIIATKRFNIYPEDTVSSLLQRTYEKQLKLFYEIIDLIRHDKPLPTSTETWTRAPFTRKEFNELFVIPPDINTHELEKRIRAVSFEQYQPSIRLHGHTFQLIPEAKQKVIN